MSNRGLSGPAHFGVYEGECRNGHPLRTSHDQNPRDGGGTHVRCSRCRKIAYIERVTVARKDHARKGLYTEGTDA